MSYRTAIELSGRHDTGVVVTQGVSPLSWESIGVELLEREFRPVVLVSADGVVLRQNRAFAFLLSGTRATLTTKLSDWVAESSMAAFEEAWRRVLAGERSKAAISLFPIAFNIEPVFEFLPIVGGHDGLVSAVLVMMVGLSSSLTPRFIPAVGIHYEIERLSETQPMRLIRNISIEGEQRPTSGRRCYEVLFGRTQKCPTCPIGKGDGPQLHVEGTTPLRLRLAWAREFSDQRFAVTMVDLDEKAYRSVVQGRVDSLSEVARLNTRERRVLDLILLGRSLDDIGESEGFTTRTAKYHQQNLLRKLGAESRVDLLRLLT